jgi:hypothetical protein
LWWSDDDDDEEEEATTIKITRKTKRVVIDLID